MPRRKKKVQAPKVVAPEPLGDEWESNYRWDRVSAAGPRQDFMTGIYTAATENLFPVKYDLKEPNPKDVFDPRPHFQLQRATEVFYQAEQKLISMNQTIEAAANAVTDFQSLQEEEKKCAEQEKKYFEAEMNAVLTETEKASKKLYTAIEQTGDHFFTEQKNILNRLFDLVSHDGEIEDAFNQRISMLAECDRVTEAYYTEHGEHVVNIEKLQLETAAEHQTAVEEMIQTLQRASLDLMQSSALAETNEPTEKNRARLINELQRLQHDSTCAIVQGEKIVHGSENLRRLVELEKQKLKLAQERNVRLKKANASLNQEASQHVAPKGQPTVGFTHRSVLSSDATNQLTELRRQFDATTQELTIMQDRVEQLRCHYIRQLNGQYRLVNPSTDALKTTHNFLDPETNAVVRSTVMDAMLEVSRALEILPRPMNDELTVLPTLPPVTTLSERKAVQNYVVKRINRLFTCRCPTAPQLLGPPNHLVG